MKIWKYRVDVKKFSDIDSDEPDYLYDMGIEGWELCGPPVIGAITDSTHRIALTYYWRKEKENS